MSGCTASDLSVEEQDEQHNRQVVPHLEGMRAMKYINSIEIALPREKVAQLLANPAHIPKWLRGLVLHEPVNGIHGQLGPKSRVVMQSGQRKIELTETITRRDPADLHGIPKESVVHFDREIVGAGIGASSAIG
jgi:hypothetical protein